MGYYGDGPLGWFGHLIGAVVTGLFTFLVFLVAAALVFLLVRFLLVATKAAQIYVAKNTPAKPVAPATPTTPTTAAAAPAATAPAATAPAATATKPATTKPATTKPAAAKPTTKPRTPKTPPTT